MDPNASTSASFLSLLQDAICSYDPQVLFPTCVSNEALPFDFIEIVFTRPVISRVLLNLLHAQSSHRPPPRFPAAAHPLVAVPAAGERVAGGGGGAAGGLPAGGARFCGHQEAPPGRILATADLVQQGAAQAAEEDGEQPREAQEQS